MLRHRMIEAAHALAASRGHACSEDLELLQMMIHQLGMDRVDVRVVQLGAGSGTMALVVLALGAHLVTVDNNAENLGWEEKVLSNIGWPANGIQGLRRQTILGDSAQTGRDWCTEIYGAWDLLIIDADHSYEAVRADLDAWWESSWTPTESDIRGRIFMHDYDGNNPMAPAPEHYPGVKQACDEVFEGDPMWMKGWSAVFEREQWTGRLSTP